MNYAYVFGIISLIGGLLSAVSPLPASAAEPPQVVITEINWAGGGRSSADEWLELGNFGGGPVDLSGWAIGGAGMSGQAIAIADGTLLEAGDILLIANYAPSDSSTLAISPNLVTTALSLPNTKLEIVLLMPDGTYIDGLSDPGTPDFGSSTPVIASMERNLSTLAWATATSSVNLLDTSQLGTPGLAYAPVPVAIEESIEPIIEVAAEPISETPIDVEVDSTGVPTEAVTEPIQEVVAETTEPEPVIDVVEPVKTNVVETTTPPSVEPEFTIDVIVEPQPEAAVVEATATEVVEEQIVSIENATETVETSPVEVTEITPAVVEVAITPDETEMIVVDTIEVTAEPTTSTVSSPTDTTPTLATTGRVILNEIMSAPSASDEWIEITNLDNVTIDLSGWSVRDASGKATLLSGNLAARGYMLIDKPLGKLNNGGDTVELVNALGKVVDSVTYGTDTMTAPSYDETLNRNGATWFVTSVATPQAVNSPMTAVETTAELTATAAIEEANLEVTYDDSVAQNNDVEPATAKPGNTLDTATADVTYTLVATASAPKSTASSKTSTRKKSTASTAARTITALSGVADGTKVSYEGVVLATPGTFGKQIAVLDGAVLYMNSAEWPSLDVGDVIRVIGETSTARGEPRIKLTGSSSITVLRHQTATSANMTYDELLALTGPRLVTVSGTVLARNSGDLTLLVDGQELSVNAHDYTGIVWSSLSTTSLVITGVVRTIDGQLVLMPRNMDDVVAQTVIAPATANTNSPSFPTKPVAGGALVTSALGALSYWFARSRTTLIPSI